MSSSFFTTRFDPVKRTITRGFICTVCGKRGRKTKTFTQTVNPWNKNAYGLPKLASEILIELDNQAAAWTPEPLHDKCRSAEER